MLTTILLPFIFQVGRIFFVLGAHAHQNAAVLDALLVVLDTLFRNVPADQRANHAATGSASAGTGNGCGQRAGDASVEPYIAGPTDDS